MRYRYGHSFRQESGGAAHRGGIAVAEAPERCALLEAIGGTPLLSLARVGRDLPPGVELFAKAEFMNPSGSLKDRTARAIIEAAEADGRLTPDRTILDATSGNGGISYAMIGTALGYRVALCLPANATPERKGILRACGAALIETDPAQGSDGARRWAAELVRAAPDRYFHALQHDNQANWLAHYRTTAAEIWSQSCGRVTHFVAGIGTSGTFMGIARRLKELNPGLRAVSVQPDRAEHGLVGLKHMASALVPRIYDPALADLDLAVSTAEAWAMCRRLLREEGLLVGPSAGASVAAALQVARGLAPGSVVVTVLFDSGTRYLAEGRWTES